MSSPCACLYIITRPRRAYALTCQLQVLDNVLPQGLDAVWVGGGQDTFYQALGVQLQNAGITRPVGSTGSTSAPNGYDFTPSSEVTQKASRAGAQTLACLVLNLDV
jgi:hypothetical protein